MKMRILNAALIAMSATSVAQANVVISEVLFNEVSSNTAGEFIEIYNNGTEAVDLSGFKIGDEETSGSTSTTEALFQFPTGATIAPGQAQVIAVDADVFNTNYGFLPTYQTNGTNASVPIMTNYITWDTDGGTLNMSNTNDQAVLVDGADAVVDAASWGNTFAFDPALGATGDGQSYFRTDPTTDTNAAADWALTQSAPDGAGFTTRSSPGVVAVPEPAGLAAAGILAAAALRRRRAR